MKLIEVQVDRLVGPTHHFGGLGVGNVASKQHSGNVSNPQAAALEGLDKMKLVAGLGAPQIVLPPQPRPKIAFLRSLGFDADDAAAVRSAATAAPALLSAASSSSAMWTANAATVSPAIDNGFGKVVLSIANLNASLHRAIESDQTLADLRLALPPECMFFGPLPGGTAMRDEGAANHMRLGASENQTGLHLFVYGDGQPMPQKYWPRQTRSACEAIARRQRIPPENAMFFKQHPRAIDAGAFHNDVVAASHHDLMIHHEWAFDPTGSDLIELEQRFEHIVGKPLRRIVVSEESLSIDEAIATYLFNSQIVTPSESGNRPVIICPSQVRCHPAASRLVEAWCSQQGVFGDAHFVDLDQSMSGGGGPACLRLRVPMTQQQIDRIPKCSVWNEELDVRLREVICRTYPTSLTLDDLANKDQLGHVFNAQEAVRRVLKIGNS